MGSRPSEEEVRESDDAPSGETTRIDPRARTLIDRTATRSSSGVRTATSDLLREFEAELHAEREARREDAEAYERRIAQLEDRVRRSGADRGRFEAILERLPVGIVLVEQPSGRIAVVNRVARGLLRGPKASSSPTRAVPSLRGLRLQGTELVVEGETLSTRLRNGEPFSGEELALVHDEKTVATVRLSAAPFEDPPGMLLVFEDVTAENADRTARERSDRFRDLFLGMLGHDLRNPLAAIISIASLMKRRGDLPSRQIASTEKIVASGERISRMIDQILDLTRERLGGGIPIERVDADLRLVLDRVVDEVEAAHPGRMLPVESLGNTQGKWDPDRMAQALSNLVGNAVAHGTTPVSITLDGSHPARVAIAVRNGGPPIHPELVPVIFDPFRRGDRVHRKAADGLGLGLFITQQIVRGHGGTIDVRSDDAETCFGIELPRGS